MVEALTFGAAILTCMLLYAASKDLSVSEHVAWNAGFGMTSTSFGIGHVKRYFREAGGISVTNVKQGNEDHWMASGPLGLIAEFERLCFWQVLEMAAKEDADKFNKEQFDEKCSFKLELNNGGKKPTFKTSLRWISSSDDFKGQAAHEFIRRGSMQVVKEMDILKEAGRFEMYVTPGSLQREVASCAVDYLDKNGNVRAASWCLSNVEVSWRTDYGLGRSADGRAFVIDIFQQDGGLIDEPPRNPVPETPLKISGRLELVCQFIRLCIWEPNQALTGCACELQQIPEGKGMLKPMTIKWVPHIDKVKKTEVAYEELILRAKDPLVKVTDNTKDIKTVEKFEASVQLGTIQRWYSNCAWCYRVKIGVNEEIERCPTWCPKEVELKWMDKVGMGKHMQARINALLSFQDGGGQVDMKSAENATIAFQVVARKSLVCEFAKLCVWKEASAQLDACDCNLFNPSKPPADGWLNDTPMHLKWVDDPKATDMKAKIKEFIDAEYIADDRNGKFIQPPIKQEAIEAEREFQAARIHVGTLQRWYIGCAWCFALDGESTDGIRNYKCPSWCLFDAEMVWQKEDGYGKLGNNSAGDFATILNKMGVKIQPVKQETKANADGDSWSGLKTGRLKASRAIFCELSKICIGAPKSRWLDGCECAIMAPKNPVQLADNIHIKWAPGANRKEVQKAEETQRQMKFIQITGSQSWDIFKESRRTFTARISRGTIQRWYIACDWCYSVEAKATKYTCASWCPAAKSKQERP